MLWNGTSQSIRVVVLNSCVRNKNGAATSRPKYCIPAESIAEKRTGVTKKKDPAHAIHRVSLLLAVLEVCPSLKEAPPTGS